MGKIVTFNELKNEAFKNTEVLRMFKEEQAKSHFKEIMRRAREKANMSQSDIARALSVPPSNISRIEKHPERANIQSILKYLDACNAGFRIQLI